MKIPSIQIAWTAIVGTLFISACNMQKDIEVPLPDYQNKLVVECYLEAYKPIRMAITESASYFDAPNLPDVRDAQVDFTYNGQRETIQYRPQFDSVNRKVYNYTSKTRVKAQENTPYVLEVSDSKGRKVVGTASFLKKIPIKSVEWRYNADSAAFLLIRFDDPANETNFYRIQVHRDSVNGSPDVDFVVDDTFSSNNEITLGTGYNYRQGETVFISLYHIEKSYYDFLESVDNAARANGNPFAQPAQIQSAIQGGIGIVATLVYDRKEVVVD